MPDEYHRKHEGRPRERGRDEGRGDDRLQPGGVEGRGSANRDREQERFGTGGSREHEQDWRKGGTGSDERIREQVADCLMDDRNVDASEITVEVRNGEVTLTGTVRDREQKRRAQNLAEHIPGVSDVTNHLRVNKQPGDRAVSTTSRTTW